jgi:hypothetical protein
VKQKERLQNWLDYYELKFERHPERRPTRRVTFPTLILFSYISGVPCSSNVSILYFISKKWEMVQHVVCFMCFRQDALVSVAGKWIK